ncbi:MAG: hypothetical protein KZQ80_06355 [Candidatus Thiodiazotropha sp. (ex Monitilora ramsayi)]|nr:hypothetical protein [Candidatus Thiodiazotropha sp. (ex Monitilora ramsayi)]
MMTLVSSASFKQSTSHGGDEPFSSPLFREVAAQFDDTTRHVILELGSASSGILALLQGKRCRLLVANAAHTLSALNEESQDAESHSQVVSTLIFDAGTEKVDTVLCWDLLNYLSLPLMKIFTSRLSRIMAPGGRVHAYIHSAHATMPQYPQRYSLHGDDHVLRLDRDPDVRKTPRYSFGDLEKHAVGLRVDRSMLLRNGVQEYLLRMKQE